ncbi:hypothetical protein BC826DRAFT_182497 [Russula brevipes]|nr:hypothetical protein BC826DRAFT_182497 [Russula brevipes]
MGLSHRMALLGPWVKPLSKKALDRPRPRTITTLATRGRGLKGVQLGAWLGCALASLLILCALHALGLPHSGWSCPSLCAAFLHCGHHNVALCLLCYTRALHLPFHLTIGCLPRRTTHSPLHAFSTFAWPPTVRVLSLLAHWYVFYPMLLPQVCSLDILFTRFPSSCGFVRLIVLHTLRHRLVRSTNEARRKTLDRTLDFTIINDSRDD